MARWPDGLMACYFSPTVSRSSRDTAMAWSAALTTCDARAFCAASCALVSSNSACARITPSWLLSLCNRALGSSVLIEWLCTLNSALCTASLRRGVIRRMLGAVRLAPESIDKDSDTAAGGAQIFNLVRRDPVVNRAPAHAHHFARLHDAYCLPFHWGCPPKGVSVTASVGLDVQISAIFRAFLPSWLADLTA